MTRGGLAPQILVGFFFIPFHCRCPNRKFPQIKLIKKKKGHDAGGPPIALGAPKLEGARGIFPTSLYDH
jgi:hypothetical protein